MCVAAAELLESPPDIDDEGPEDLHTALAEQFDTSDGITLVVEQTYVDSSGEYIVLEESCVESSQESDKAGDGPAEDSTSEASDEGGEDEDGDVQGRVIMGPDFVGFYTSADQAGKWDTKFGGGMGMNGDGFDEAARAALANGGSIVVCNPVPSHGQRWQGSSPCPENPWARLGGSQNCMFKPFVVTVRQVPSDHIALDWLSVCQSSLCPG